MCKQSNVDNLHKSSLYISILLKQHNYFMKVDTHLLQKEHLFINLFVVVTMDGNE
jgi:hypothetical protein